MITKLYRLLLAVCSIMIIHPVQAEGIVISTASSKLVDDVYQLNAKLEFDLESEILHAIEHGVSINIDIIILIKRERDWLWDPKIKEETLSFRLEQHPLSKRYLITNLDNGYKQQFKYREDALEYLGTINDHFLISRSVLAEGEAYICMLKAESNTETLPAVIRPIAFVSKKWQMDSDWISWSLTDGEYEQ